MRTRTPCDVCGQAPARMLLPDSRRWLCGVCAHRLAVATDLARRVAMARIGSQAMHHAGGR